MRVLQRNKDTLKKTSFQVKDLELKINVLTYKVQYGTWPMANYAKRKFKNKFNNDQCGFPKLKGKDSWIKNCLLK